ncbi:reverse transcriptase domain-containing protein [Tanacetum coccineum]
MVPATAPLIGFSREIIWPMGQILLLEGHECGGSSSLVKAHEMLIFPVPRGITHSLKRIKVTIHLEHPEQTIAIGSTIIEEERKSLCELPRRNLDIFAWKPKDMTGVLRHLAEHRLNFREGCSPVRQKKRSQAPERNKAIQEEVRKLMDAVIMKEVHYHSWLSNPVMVKKHDNSWRMCVDFKDINKACPKDGYPLPEIDCKNAGATYQRLVDKAFQKQIGINMENRGRHVLGIQSEYRGDKGVSGQSGSCFKPVIPKMSKRYTKVEWKVSKPEAAFKEMKKLTAKFPTLIVLRENEELIVYLAGFEDKLHTNGKAGTSFSTCKQTAKKILLGTHDHCHHGPTNQASTIKARGRMKAVEMKYRARFKFDATNNEAEYEALIAGLRIAEQMGVKNLQTNMDSRLVANQVNRSYIAKDPGMIQYLEKVKTLSCGFKKFSIKQVPRSENKKADALRKIASTSFAHLTKQVLVEELKEKSINEAEVLAVSRKWRHMEIHSIITT